MKTIIRNTFYCALILFTGAVLAGGDCEMQPARGANSIVKLNSNGTGLTSVEINGKKYELIRDQSTNSVTGIRNGNVIIARPPIAATTNTSQPENRSLQNAPSGEVDYVYCDGSGNGGSTEGAYVSAVLPRTEVTVDRAQNQVFWTETLQQQVYTPQMPAALEPPLPSLSPEEKLKKCTAETNSCIQTADNISSGAYGLCANMASEMASKRGRVWGAVVIVIAANLCVEGIERSRATAKNICYSKHVDCVRGS